MSANFKDRMADYVPVNERIEAFKSDWPEGSLQSSIVELTESRVTIKAYAYRTPDDQRPGIGHSSLEIPGSTPYTKGSEIENAETSAWGRAIAALGFEVKRGIASREEVRNKPADRTRKAAPPGGARTAEEMALLDELLAIPGMTKARMSLLADGAGVKHGQRATADQLREMLALTAIPLPDAVDDPVEVAPGQETLPLPEVG